ncbi:MAG: hypothetical protein PHI79_06770 [Sulfurovaceae bacterium]|nr:hypothetical protein [Sulfurovaceae bacterium]
MNKVIAIMMLVAVIVGATVEYDNFLNTHKTTSPFYCKGGALVNEYFNDINATKAGYRIIVINNSTVKCNVEDNFIVIPDLGIRVEVTKE